MFSFLERGNRRQPLSFLVLLRNGFASAQAQKLHLKSLIICLTKKDLLSGPKLITSIIDKNLHKNISEGKSQIKTTIEVFAQNTYDKQNSHCATKQSY